MFSGRVTKTPPLSPLLSKVNGLKGHWAYYEHWKPMCVVSCLIHYDRLLQNVTDIITKCDSFFITE